MSNPQDRFHLTNQWEYLQQKYGCNLTADSRSHDFAVQVHRDSTSTFIGNPSLLSYLSLVEGNHPAKTAVSLIEKMIQPCGPTPQGEGS
ncbi:hypothetical protein RCL1_004250 [Eukaryota sp. TZLM3-RCL]